MKQMFVGMALLAAFGTAHAYDSVGDTTDNSSYLRVGPTTSTGFHGPAGAPGVGLGHGESWYISLQSISIPGFTLKETVNGVGRYQLLGYAHTPEQSVDPIDVNFNWGKVNTTGTGAKQVYFGLTTDKNTTETIAFYVGDKENRAVPNTDTNYAVLALVVPNGADGTNPQVLSGSLKFDQLAQTLNSVGDLTDGSNNLAIATSVTGTNFSGTGIYSNASTAATAGVASGQFFGGGANSGSSAVAGIVDGSNVFQAAFGGGASN